jgi:hypothetical protein
LLPNAGGEWYNSGINDGVSNRKSDSGQRASGIRHPMKPEKKHNCIRMTRISDTGFLETGQIRAWAGSFNNCKEDTWERY